MHEFYCKNSDTIDPEYWKAFTQPIKFGNCPRKKVEHKKQTIWSDKVIDSIHTKSKAFKKIFEPFIRGNFKHKKIVF